MVSKVNGLSFWQVFLVLIVLGAAIALILDRSHGYTPQMYEQFPWDISGTLNVFCGLSLAVGGMTIAAVLAVLELAEYRLLRRCSLAIAYLGFLSALAATVLRYRLHPETIWNLWSPRTIPAGAGVAFVLYTIVMLDDVLAQSSLGKLTRILQRVWVRYVAMILTCSSAFLAGLQESAFLNIMALAPQQFSPMWVTSMLPINIFLSGVCACLALIVFAIWNLSRRSETIRPAETFETTVAALRILLVFAIGVRMLELTDVHQWHNLAQRHLHDYLLGLELALFLTPALFLLNLRKSEHRSAYECSIMVVAGFLVNRLNVAITSREVVIGVAFTPRVSDLVFAVAVIALGVATFIFVVKRDREFDRVIRSVQEPQHPASTLLGGAALMRSDQ